MLVLVLMFWFYQRDLSSTVEPSAVTTTMARIKTPAATAALNPTSSAAVVPSFSDSSGTGTAAATGNTGSRLPADTNGQQSPAVTPAQLTQARSDLEQLEQSLADLRGRQSLRNRQLDLDYPYQINVNTQQIQSLNEARQNLRAAEGTVHQQSQLLMQEQILAARLARENLDPAIADLERALTEAGNEIQLLQGIGLRSRDQEARLQQLLTERVSWEQQLNGLRAQKIAAANQALEQLRNISGYYQQQRADLAGEQIAVEDEIALRRQQILDLQLARQQMRMSLIPLSQQISQTEQAYTAQLGRVRALEQRLPAPESGAPAPPGPESGETGISSEVR